MMTWAAETLGVSQTLVGQGVATIIAVAAAIVVRLLVLRAAAKRVDDTEVIFRIRKTSAYVTTAIVVVVLARIWSSAFNDVGTFLGLLSAGVAIALADFFLNLAGWVYIMLRRPFRAGDRVEIGGNAGDVVDIRLLRFTLLEINKWVDADQSTGRLVHIPNGLLFRESMANYTEGFNYLWHEIPVLVTFESDWRRAEELIRAVLDRHQMTEDALHAAREFRNASRQYILRPGELAATVYVDVRDSGVLLTARVLIKPRERRVVSDKLWRGILEAFAADPTVDFAYPTIRAHGVQLSESSR